MASAVHGQQPHYTLELSQDRSSRKYLNTIQEESESESSDISPRYVEDRRKNQNGSTLRVDQWLSPMSDHFPTPRGVHFMPAPVLPESPSNKSFDSASTNFLRRSGSDRTSYAETVATEFDDLSDDEHDRQSTMHSSSRRKSGLQTSLTKLVIPTRADSLAAKQTLSATELQSAKSFASPVQIASATHVVLSPAVANFMERHQHLDIPRGSAPPSLDGSMSSEQLAALSAPPTPVVGPDGDDAEPGQWQGVHLDPSALATLRAFSKTYDDEESEAEPEPVIEMQQQQPAAEMFESRRPGLNLFTNLSQDDRRTTFTGLAQLEIPSPSTFFQELPSATRNTWHAPSSTSESASSGRLHDDAPPTSGMAEQFYRAPWKEMPLPPLPSTLTRSDLRNTDANPYRRLLNSSSPVEQVVVIPDNEDDEDNLSTARPILTAVAIPPTSARLDKDSESVNGEVEATEIVRDDGAKHVKHQQELALSNLARMETWLAAQRTYLRGVGDETETFESVKPLPVEEAPPAVPEKDFPVKEPVKVEVKTETEGQTTSVIKKKKSVRFSVPDVVSNHPYRLPCKLIRQESAYYRAFMDYIVRYRPQDVFIHKTARFEFLQAQRACLRGFHRNQLLGKYQLSVVPQSKKKRLSANVARGDDELIDDPVKIRREKELDAMSQMAMAIWQVAAIKLLNGGRLISSPVSKRLARLSRMGTGVDGTVRDRARILDLGGQGACDWAWHCAHQYPNTKVYTVTTKAIRQMSNSNIRGPPNHRQVAVNKLSHLPFQENQFDVVSARELHSILKSVGENGEDEWDACLRECMRILKPGGYLEFSVLDSDMVNAGPNCLAKSVEFGFTLKTLGYDPTPSHTFISRLGRAGFAETRRAWVCMPMGERRPPMTRNIPLRASTVGEEVHTHQLEAMVMGSTENVASVCSIAAGWSWERWLLRCETERLASELRLQDTTTDGEVLQEAGKCLEGLHSVIDEGRECGAAWRMLNGYARKPKVALTREGTIRMMLAE